MIVVGDFADARKLRSGTVGLVPTMGYLHEGHLRLVATSAARCDTTIVSVFVNPRQFDDAADLAAYPRDLDRDVALAEASGADVVFAPSADHMYAGPGLTTVAVASVGDSMEGAHRRGHFAGVATVVAKLFAGLQPDVAFFGRKDAQQLAVVRTLTTDLSLPVEVAGVSTVREMDGLALSSRNTRLSPKARRQAVVLSRALFAAGEHFAEGERTAASLVASARSVLRTVPDIEVDYVTTADAATARPVDTVEAESFLATAATIGGVRLIDNVVLDPADGTVDAGTRLDRPSILYGGR